MGKETKIVLPFYKLAYAVSFIVILSLIRGGTYTYEIGIALEAPMAMLVTVFCADTYVQEIVSKRSEVHRLYPMKKRVCSIGKRLLIQSAFLLLLAVIGYGLFFVFQKPYTHPITENEAKQFAVYFFAITVTTFFWGALSNTLSLVFRNMWAGIGGCLLLWLSTYSAGGERYLGAWNLFSYSFRNIEGHGGVTWIYGKVLSIGVYVVLLAGLPKILEERG